MSTIKIHFIPKKKFNKLAYKGVCGTQWAELTYKTERVTCQRCQQSPAFKFAQENSKQDQRHELVNEYHSLEVAQYTNKERLENKQAEIDKLLAELAEIKKDFDLAENRMTEIDEEIAKIDRG